MGKIILDPLNEVIVLFFYVLMLMFIIIGILLLSTIIIEVKGLKISTEKHHDSIIDDNYKIIISFWNLKKIRILKTEITKEKLENIKIKEIIEKQIKKIDFIAFFKNIKINYNLNFKTIKKTKKFMPKITYINLKSNIGTEDAIFTSYIVAIIASTLGFILKDQNINSKKRKFIINPIYVNKNMIDLELNCILKTKLIHIIYIIYILIKKGSVNKNDRTSNRRTYGYSYE